MKVNITSFEKITALQLRVISCLIAKLRYYTYIAKYLTYKSLQMHILKF